MARPRGQSTGEGMRTPHSVSLKVLRLSRPSLQYQYTLPAVDDDGESIRIDPKASLSYAADNAADSFVISPVLTLPESFRSAYVGEEFACTLCANNELLPDDASKSISAVKILAEMQLPMGETVTLDMEDGEAGAGDTEPSKAGDTIQKIVRLNLSEPGQHVLGVTVTYTETQHAPGGGGAHGARVRTFRKLYQFIAQPLINVKTKTGDLPATKAGKARYALEAQLQNLADRTVCLEAVSVDPKEPFKWRSLNWDAFSPTNAPAHAPILNPNDTLQVAFLLEETAGSKPAQLDGTDDKVILGQLNIQWRSAMGDRGSLRTSWLTGRRRALK
ncbi:uncharacterized protein PV09_03680 [Verruconis gallopava]|uniref:Trafficking protein particle complex subunit 13 n=1 Tax=Verruconis gallopava TaxID=253628 RepID=A0A0D1XR03_9PEZI|nr:uncharacterized protein PV09_03680 [Verruconis gallopava]KIW05126.1 hypothetical protein PV09_03680 [Verruconis gallopava]